MPAILVDVVDSTGQTEVQGAQAIGPRIDERLQQVVETFQSVDPNLWVGRTADGSLRHEGDGLLLLGHGELAVLLVQAAVVIQLQEGLDVRIAMGVGDITWFGPEWSAGSTFRGPVVNFISRLKSVCAPGGIVFNEGLRLALSGAPRLLALADSQRGNFAGFAGQRLYWSLRIARSLATRTEDVIRDECRGVREDLLAVQGTVARVEFTLSRVDGHGDELDRRLDTVVFWMRLVAPISLGLFVYSLLLTGALFPGFAHLARTVVP